MFPVSSHTSQSFQNNSSRIQVVYKEEIPWNLKERVTAWILNEVLILFMP